MAGGSFIGWGGGPGPGPIGTTVGTMPVGAGPVGGASPVPDYGTPQVINIVPAPLSTLQDPKPVIEFDVIDYEGNLDPLSVKVWVNGVAVFDNGQPQKFFWDWDGAVTTITLGLHIVLAAPDFLGDGLPVTVELHARDTFDNRLKRAWSFTTYPATTITSYRLLDNRCLELTFDPALRVDGELFRPSNYGISVRLGYAKEVYTGAVTSPSQVPDDLVDSVIICMRDFFSLNGRYAVRVQGVHDEFGRVIDTGDNNFNA